MEDIEAHNISRVARTGHSHRVVAQHLGLLCRNSGHHVYVKDDASVNVSLHFHVVRAHISNIDRATSCPPLG